MQKTNIRRLIYRIKHDYLTMNNVVIAVAFIVGIGWAWGSIGIMQRNFGLQKEVDAKKRELTLTQLQIQTLQYEEKYYQSAEYKELAVRDRLGFGNPGEMSLILPPNSKRAVQSDIAVKPKTAASLQAPSSFQQWMNFLFGGQNSS